MSFNNQTFVNCSNGTNLFAGDNIYLVAVIVAFLTSAFSLFVNATLFAGAANEYKKLKRQSYMFHCIISMTLSNACFNAIAIVIFGRRVLWSTSTMEAYENHLWAVSESLFVCCNVIICGNVSALVVASLDGSYYVGRSFNPAHKEPKTKSVKNRKHMALFTVVSSWVFPLMLTVVGVFWNCSTVVCQSYDNHVHLHPTCANIYRPLKKSFLGIVVLLWICAGIVPVFGIFLGIRKYNKMLFSSKNRHVSSSTDLSESPSLVSAKKNQLPSTSSAVEFVPANSMGTLDRSVNFAKVSQYDEKSVSNRKKKCKLNHRIRFAIKITVAFFISILPSIIFVGIDMSDASTELNIKIHSIYIITVLFMWLFTLISPYLIVSHFPRLKSSLHSLFLKTNCKKSRKVQTVKQTADL